MNREQLGKILLMNKVPKDLYSLAGGLPNEAYCIDKENDRWQVYYSERGIKTNIGYCESEEEACKCLLEEIKKIVSLNYS